RSISPQSAIEPGIGTRKALFGNARTRPAYSPQRPAQPPAQHLDARQHGGVAGASRAAHRAVPGILLRRTGVSFGGEAAHLPPPCFADAAATCQPLSTDQGSAGGGRGVGLVVVSGRLQGAKKLL